KILQTWRVQPDDSLILKQAFDTNISWLYQVVVYVLFSIGGIYAVSALFSTLWVTIGYQWFRLTRAASFPALGLPLAAACVLICQNRFEPRAEVFSYLFFLLTIKWLFTWSFDQPLSRVRIAKFLLLQVLWSNMHSFFLLGPAAVALKLFFETVGRR